MELFIGILYIFIFILHITYSVLSKELWLSGCGTNSGMENQNVNI